MAAVIKRSSITSSPTPLAAVATPVDGLHHVFEIEDFTCATDWERFVAKIRDKFHEWKIDDGALGNKCPCHTKCTISYSGRDYDLEFVCITSAAAAPSAALATSPRNETKTSTASSASVSSMSHDSLFDDLLDDKGNAVAITRRTDHTINGPHITKWFGVTHFVTLSPCVDRRVGRSEACTLLSTLSMAAASCGSIIPILVPINETWKRNFYGRTTFGNVRFDVRSSDATPPSLRHLAGISEYFGDKVRAIDPVEDSGKAAVNRTLVAASFTYSQSSKDWEVAEHGVGDCTWRDVSQDAKISYGTFWGPKTDPLASLRLCTSWPFFPEGTFVDNAVWSDLDPLAAPNWTVTVDWSRDHHFMDTPLANSIRRMLEAARDAQSLVAITDVLGAAKDVSSVDGDSKRSGPPKSPTLANDTTTGFVRSLRSHIETATLTATHGMIPSAEFIDQILRDTFDPTKIKSKPAGATSTTTAPPATSPSTPSVDVVEPSVRPCPFGSLLSIFVMKALSTHQHGRLNLRTMCLLWTEFVSELRNHWESNQPIPRLLSGDVPDFGYCLLHQKLQLLSRCQRIATQLHAQETSLRNLWRCGQCTYDNPSTAARCSMCDTPKVAPVRRADQQPSLAVAQPVPERRPIPGIAASTASSRAKSATLRNNRVGHPSQPSSTPSSSPSLGSQQSVTPTPTPDWSTWNQAWDDDNNDEDAWGSWNTTNTNNANANANTNTNTNTGASMASTTTTSAPLSAKSTHKPKSSSRGSSSNSKLKVKLVATSLDNDSASDDDDNDVFFDFDSFDAPHAAVAAAATTTAKSAPPTVPSASTLPSSTSNLSKSASSASSSTSSSSTSSVAEGISHVLDGVLMLGTKRIINVPITQEPLVMTADSFEEQKELFARMGSSEEATRLRAEIQGASLLSDMQAFKAANPACIFEDFVRWHSPKDWRAFPTDGSHVDDGHPIDESLRWRGMLSKRMRSSANFWHTLWTTAEAIPAHKQKPLFDHQAEAERILNYFENVEPSALFKQLALISVANALSIFALTDGAMAGLDVVRTSVSRMFPLLKQDTLIEPNVADDIGRIELSCARATSLLYCLPFSTRLVNSLMRHRRSGVNGADERQEMLDLFTGNGQRPLPKRECAEYTLLRPALSNGIIMDVAGATDNGCAADGHRLYASISDSNFVLATAWDYPL